MQFMCLVTVHDEKWINKPAALAAADNELGLFLGQFPAPRIQQNQIRLDCYKRSK